MLPSFSTLPPTKKTAWPASNVTVNEAELAEGALSGSEVGAIGRCLQEEVATELGFEGCIGVCQTDMRAETLPAFPTILCPQHPAWDNKY